jgi:deoxyxylulose-5-phosphate synthase
LGIGKLLERHLQGDGPYIDNKMHSAPIQVPGNDGEFIIQTFTYSSKDRSSFENPTFLATMAGAPEPSVTIAAYGYMADLAQKAIYQLAYEHEIFAELVVPTRCSPFEVDAILDSARRTKRLLTLEEGTLTLGWGAEVAARAAESSGGGLQATRRLAAPDLPIPASRTLEAAVLPGVVEIVGSVREMI